MQRRQGLPVIIVRTVLLLSGQPSTLVSLMIVMVSCGVSAAMFQSTKTTTLLQAFT